MPADWDKLPAFLQEKLIPEPNTGCWLYAGNWDTGNGYGKVRYKGKQTVIHRAVYEELVGPIPVHHVLDHRVCLVRACSNPDHLEPVTVRVNTYRGRAVLYGRTR